MLCNRLVGDQAVDIASGKNGPDDFRLVEAAGYQQAVWNRLQVRGWHGDDGMIQLMVNRLAAGVEKGTEDFADGADFFQFRQALAHAVNGRELGSRSEIAAGDDRDVRFSRTGHHFVDAAVREEKFAALDARAVNRCGDIEAVGAERFGEFRGDLEGVRF